MRTNSRFWILSILIVAVALCRYFLINIPNAAPIAAIALFGGAYFAQKRYALLVPIIAMLLSDIMLELTFRMGMQPFRGFYPMMIIVYSSFIIIVMLGRAYLRSNTKPLPIVFSSIAAGIIFFLITNGAVWAMGKGESYPLDLSGLILCYSAGLPFLKNTLISNLLFSVALFGSFEFILLRFPKLLAATSR